MTELSRKPPSALKNQSVNVVLYNVNTPDPCLTRSVSTLLYSILFYLFYSSLVSSKVSKVSKVSSRSCSNG